MIDFYELIDEALENPVTGGAAVNAAQHIWGYVDDIADEKTEVKYEKEIAKVATGDSTRSLKRILWQLSKTKEQQYLIDSLYFSEIY